MADESTDHPEDQAAPTEPAADTPAAAEDAPAEVAQEISEQHPETDEPVVEQPLAEQPSVEESSLEEAVVAEQLVAGESTVEQPSPEEPAAGEEVAEESTVEGSAVEGSIAERPAAEEQPAAEEEEAEVEEEEAAPRVKPSVPGAHLEVDIVPEGVDPLAPEQPADPYALEEDEEPKSEEDAERTQLSEPISSAAIDLAAGARYKATGKRKTAIARVVLRPGSGTYLVNGRALEGHFPRVTLQRNIRQPLETVGYQERMDVVARLHGGGISAQAGALRHGISRALLEADPNLRGELKRRGFLTRDSRAKERKKAGLKKARKRPQFSKR
jgi:small subunit ribosomal protein S9